MSNSGRLPPKKSPLKPRGLVVLPTRKRERSRYYLLRIPLAGAEAQAEQTQPEKRHGGRFGNLKGRHLRVVIASTSPLRGIEGLAAKNASLTNHLDKTIPARTAECATGLKAERQSRIVDADLLRNVESSKCLGCKPTLDSRNRLAGLARSANYERIRVAKESGGNKDRTIQVATAEARQ
jgi:hypothetical protein